LTVDLQSYFSILDGCISTQHSTCHAAYAARVNPHRSDRGCRVDLMQQTR